MEAVISVLIILTCVLLVLIVLVQNPKGGGLSSAFGGGGTQMLGGVKKTTDFLDRGTWVLSILLVVLVMFANIYFTPEQSAEELARPEALQIENTESTPSIPAGSQQLDPSLMPQELPSEDDQQ